MFREKITRNYQSLSRSFEKIADFILADHQRASFMSASRLAKHLGVDVATVTRFAQQMGYTGYTQLIREIQEKVLEEMRAARAPVTERLEAARDPFTHTLWRDWANLEKTIQNLPQEQVDQALEALRSARRIYLVSEGMGAGLASAMASYLRMVKPEVIALTQGPFELAMALKDLGPEDVVLGIGFTRYAHAAARAMEVGRGLGAKTIGIISHADCPIGGEAEILLSCSATQEGYLPSTTATSAILFALFHSLTLDDAGAYDRELDRFQGAYVKLAGRTAPANDQE